jgi:hypothetical protein
MNMDCIHHLKINLINAILLIANFNKFFFIYKAHLIVFLLFIFRFIELLEHLTQISYVQLFIIIFN